MNLAAIGLFFGIFCFVLAVAMFLSPPEQRRTTALLVTLGLLSALIKIWLVQQTPQWQDINPDSITYDSNARAFAQHWNGGSVEADVYRLRGLKTWSEQGLHDSSWRLSDQLSYTSVVGSIHWLYPAYVGIWYWLTDDPGRWVIYSNAAFVAIAPAAAFCIGLLLGVQRPVAMGAALLALIDPSLGVAASVLLKDALVSFLAVAGFWAVLRFFQYRSLAALLIAVGLVALLAISRYTAFVALQLVLVVGLFGAMSGRDWGGALRLGCLMVGALLVAGQLLLAPRFDSVPKVIQAVVQPVIGGGGILIADRDDERADDAVVKWKEALHSSPFLASFKSVMHTLFAPYPWVAIYPGLTWNTFVELYYPGVVLWILCLPGIIWSTCLLLKKGGAVHWMTLAFLGSLLTAYTLFMGEWSTRQRVFVLPVFYALAALGWSDLIRRLASRVRLADVH